MTQDKLIDRIRKLYAHAESAKSLGNEEEALAFLAKVDEMLTAHKLSVSVIEETDTSEREEIGTEYVEAVDGERKARRSGWIERLAGVVAKAYFCRILVIPGSNTVVLVGKASDRQVAEYVLRQLVAFVKEEERRQYNILRRDPLAVRTGFFPSFRAGFNRRVSERFRELRAKHKADPETGGRYALVLADSAAALTAYMEQFTGKARRTRQSVSNRAGYRAGQEAGNRANLGANAVRGGSSSGPRHLTNGG